MACGPDHAVTLASPIVGVSAVLSPLRRVPSPRYHRFVSRTFVLPSLSSNPLNEKNKFADFSMSSTGQATPPRAPTSNYQLIISALADYAQITGIDLAKHPFAAALEQSTSPEAILQLLQGREKAFKEYLDGNRRLISYLTPAVNVIQAFSGILGDAGSLVSHTCQRYDL